MSPTAEMEHVEAALDARVEGLGISQLIESPFNPRKTFRQDKLEELAASIREKGVVEPIVVRQVDAGSHKPMKFEIVCGARRYRAAKLAGVTHLLAVIRAYTDTQIVEIMAIENGQRVDVLPLEEAAGYKQLLGLDKGYSAAMIATRIGRSEKYVWDRLKLLDAIEEVRELLVHGFIGVEHAEIIAKLKPSEQKRVVAQQNGGLFTADYALAFDDEKPAGSTGYDRVKPVSVRELKQWIARNIRFDVKHAAAAAPLDFGPAAQRVEQAEADPGRGKKVVPITFEHMCPSNAADDKERTYGSTAWKKAEGKDGQPTCEHAVLGVTVAGEHYGQTFHVCIARDKCTVHWKQEIAAREKTQKLRESGKTTQANRRESAADAKEKRDGEVRAAQEARWKPLSSALKKAVQAAAAKTPAVLPKPLFAWMLQQHRLPKTTTPAQLQKALLLDAVGGMFDLFMWHGDQAKYIAAAKIFGVDVKALEPKAAAPKAKAS